MRSVFLYSLEKGESQCITDGMGASFSPVFDKSGKYLYFLASTDAVAGRIPSGNAWRTAWGEDAEPCGDGSARGSARRVETDVPRSIPAGA
jgi:hypothetical protein